VHRAKIIFYTQGPKYRKMGRMQRVIRKCILDFLDVHWITPVLGDPGPESCTFDRIVYIPFVLPPGTPPGEKKWFRDGMINIMTVGKFLPRKNHIFLLHALGELLRNFRLRLTIVGECSTEDHQAELERVKGITRSLGLDQAVEIKLNLPFYAVHGEYAVHDLFVLPSKDEPAAVSILEAMSHGLPVICSDSNGTKCYIEEGVNGYVFRNDDLSDLVEKITKIIADPKRLVEMGKNSYQIALEKHRPDLYVQAISRIMGVDER